MIDLLRSLLRRLRKYQKNRADSMTVRHHRDDDGGHHVEIHALKVLILQEGSHWVAQGLDLDYAAAGHTIEDAKNRFAQGLCLTIDQHLEKRGSLDALIRPAPPEIWQHYYSIESSLETWMQDFSPPEGITPPSFAKLAFLQPSRSAMRAASHAA